MLMGRTPLDPELRFAPGVGPGPARHGGLLGVRVGGALAPARGRGPQQTAAGRGREEPTALCRVHPGRAVCSEATDHGQRCLSTLVAPERGPRPQPATERGRPPRLPVILCWDPSAPF